jgi:hypothetical protein
MSTSSGRAEAGLQGIEPSTRARDPQTGSLPWIESPIYEELLAARTGDQEQRSDAEFYRENGYLIMRGAVPDALIERIKAEARPLFRPQVVDGARSGYRVQDAWKESVAVRELAGIPVILDKLRFLYGREPFPFQTLNFLHGSQQRTHSDTIHFSCRPARFMCGVWAALEDVTADNGPLFYYPGSHLLPEYNYYDMGMTARGGDYKAYEDFLERLVAARSLQRESLRAKKGDILIWASNLMHGGEKILAPDSTRWSQVTHYYFRDCLYFTPMHSDYLTGEIGHREVMDVTTGKFVEQSYNGNPFSVFPTGGGRYRVSAGSHLSGKIVTMARRAAWLLRMKLASKPGAYPG